MVTSWKVLTRTSVCTCLCARMCVCACLCCHSLEANWRERKFELRHKKIKPFAYFHNSKGEPRLHRLHHHPRPPLPTSSWCQLCPFDSASGGHTLKPWWIFISSSSELRGFTLVGVQEPRTPQSTFMAAGMCLFPGRVHVGARVATIHLSTSKPDTKRNNSLI